MAEGFDLGSIYSTLDLDMTGFMAGLDQGRSALADFIKNSAAQVLTLPPPALPDAALQAPDVGQGVSATPSQLAEAARAPLERLDALDMSVPPLQLADDLAPRTPPLTAPRLPPLAAQVTELPAKMSRAATSAAAHIITAFAQGSEGLAHRMQTISTKLVTDAIGGLTKGFDLLKDLGLNLSKSTQQLIQGSIGIAIVGITGLLNQGKADVKALGDEAKQGVESVEKTRGLIAGQSTIQLQQLSQNLGMALRPTNEILGRLEQLQRQILSALTGQPVPDAPSGSLLTNQLYASELLGSARLG